MTEKMDKEHVQELKEMVLEKKPREPVEKVLAKFCSRHGVSLETCRIHYNNLVEKGEIKEREASAKSMLKAKRRKTEKR